LGGPTTTRSAIYDTNCHDKPDSVTDANGNTTTETYNATTCTLTQVTQPAVAGGSPLTQYTYNTRGQVLTKTDPLNKVTNFNYSTTNETLTSVVDDSGRLGPTVSYTYDSYGDPITVTDPDGHVTNSTYDLLRRVTKVASPYGLLPAVTTVYSPDGLVLQRQEYTGASTPAETTTWTYSPSGKPLTRNDANGNVTTYAYDPLDRLASVTDAVGRVTTYAYDPLNRPTSVSNPSLQTWPILQYAYTADGQLFWLADARGNKTTYTYDGLDRLSQSQYPLTSVSTPGTVGSSDATNYEAVLTRDANGNVLTRRKRDGNTISYIYDALNRPTTRQEGAVYYNFAYDLTGRMLSAETAASAGAAGPGVVYGYDTAGRLTSEATGNSTNSLQMTYTVDLAGNRTKETWPGGYYASYTYDQLNRVTAVGENGATTGAGVLGAYVYDAIGRRASLTFGDGTSTAYAYDAGDRLTSLTLTAPASTSFNLTRTLTYTAANQLYQAVDSNTAYGLAVGTNSTVNDTADGLNRDARIVALSGGYDLNGNVTNDGTRTFTYDLGNRLTGVTLSGTTVALAYDPVGRLTQQVTTVGSTPTTTRYLYDGPRLVAEYDVTGTIVLRCYVPGPGTDAPVVWYEGSGVTDRRSLHTDERGSVIAWSNIGGVIAASQIQTYDPYGAPGSWGGSRYAFTGQIAIPEVQLYDYKARFYDPASGHFERADPISYQGGANLYAYVTDDPTDLTDPTGWSQQPGPSTATGGGGNSGQPPIVTAAAGDEEPGDGAGAAAGGGAAESETVTAFRVEGAGNQRLVIGADGSVDVPQVLTRSGTERNLYLNFGDEARAQDFLQQRLGQFPDSTVKTFEVPKSFVDDLRANAVPEAERSLYPDRPVVADPTKAVDQFGLSRQQIDQLRQVIKPGSGRPGG
jgi:RHS repeat-associated protein